MWAAVGLGVVVVIGCAATIIYVNLEEEESLALPEGSWALVLGGRLESGPSLSVEAVDVGGQCGGAQPPLLPPLPPRLSEGQLSAFFLPSEGLMACGGLPPSCFLLTSGVAEWEEDEQATLPHKLGEGERSVGGAGVLSLGEERYRLGGSSTEEGATSLSSSIERWQPGTGTWHLLPGWCSYSDQQ